LAQAIGQDKLDVSLVGGRRSSFEITAGSELIFSKLSSGQWPVASDIIAKVNDVLSGKKINTEGKTTESAKSCAGGSCGVGSCGDKAGDKTKTDCSSSEAEYCEMPKKTTFKARDAKAGANTTVSMMFIAVAVLCVAGGYLATHL